jgi:hypothetical protein
MVTTQFRLNFCISIASSSIFKIFNGALCDENEDSRVLLLGQIVKIRETRINLWGQIISTKFTQSNKYYFDDFNFEHMCRD